jgi:hypothetical protein
MRIVFCGGCDPHIDRVALADALRGDDALSASATTVYISGCSRACASGHLTVIDESGTAVVAGECLDGMPTDTGELAVAVTRKLKE